MKTYSRNTINPDAMSKISLRAVKNRDCETIWLWANDPVTRKASFSSQPILWEDHVKWFELKLKDSNCLLYMINQAPATFPVGILRYDIDGKHAIISINIAPDHRQKNIGSRAVSLSEKTVFRKTPIETIHAFIKINNIRSINMFTRLGYTNTGMTLINNSPAYDYTKTRNH